MSLFSQMHGNLVNCDQQITSENDIYCVNESRDALLHNHLLEDENTEVTQLDETTQLSTTSLAYVGVDNWQIWPIPRVQQRCGSKKCSGITCNNRDNYSQLSYIPESFYLPTPNAFQASPLSEYKSIVAGTRNVHWLSSSVSEPFTTSVAQGQNTSPFLFTHRADIYPFSHDVYGGLAPCKREILQSEGDFEVGNAPLFESLSPPLGSNTSKGATRYNHHHNITDKHHRETNPKDPNGLAWRPQSGTQQCPICNKELRRDLLRHMKTHEEIADYVCPFPRETCNHKRGQFNRPYEYKKHLMNSHFKFDDSVSAKNTANLCDKLILSGTCPCGAHLASADKWITEHLVEKVCPSLDIDGMKLIRANSATKQSLLKSLISKDTLKH